MAALQGGGQALDMAERERGDDSTDGDTARALLPGQAEGAQPLDGSAERRVLAQPVAEAERAGAFGQMKVEAVFVDLEPVGQTA